MAGLMWVKLVQRMATGMPLTADELREATVHQGHLTVVGGSAYLTLTEDVRNGHVVPQLVEAVASIKGDRIVVTGTEVYVLGGRAQTHPQKWTCQIAPQGE